MDKTTNRVLAGIVAVVFVIAAVVMVMGGRPVTQLDKSKPEGVVQAYLQATLARDFEQAASYLAADSLCKADYFSQTYIPESAQVSLTSVSASATTATVTVSVDISNNDPFGSSYQEPHSYRLAKAGDTWALTGSPWPLYDCGVMK